MCMPNFSYLVFAYLDRVASNKPTYSICVFVTSADWIARFFVFCTVHSNEGHSIFVVH